VVIKNNRVYAGFPEILNHLYSFLRKNHSAEIYG